MFVIMGATGQVGGAALEALKQRGVAMRAVSREPARAVDLGVETMRGDAADMASLRAAFRGAKAALVMLVPPPHASDVLGEARTAAHSIAAAVRSARVPHVVALSSVGAHLSQKAMVSCGRFMTSRQPLPMPRRHSSSCGREIFSRTGRRC